MWLRIGETQFRNFYDVVLAFDDGFAILAIGAVEVGHGACTLSCETIYYVTCKCLGEHRPKSGFNGGSHVFGDELHARLKP